MTTWINCNLTFHVKRENVPETLHRERHEPSPPLRGGSLFATPGPVKYSWQGILLPVYQSGQREDAPGLNAFWANRQYFPSLCMTNCQAGKKWLIIRFLFSCCAILCTASMVTLLNGPLVSVTTDSCYTKIPKSCLHLMKLVPWESEATRFHTSNSTPSTHHCFQANTALQPLQKAGFSGYELTLPLLDLFQCFCA